MFHINCTAVKFIADMHFAIVVAISARSANCSSLIFFTAKRVCKNVVVMSRLSPYKKSPQRRKLVYLTPRAIAEKFDTYKYNQDGKIQNKVSSIAQVYLVSLLCEP